MRGRARHSITLALRLGRALCDHSVKSDTFNPDRELDGTSLLIVLPIPHSRRVENMSNPKGSTDPKPNHQSIARRRDVLRRIGMASMAAGAASPLSALAGTGWDSTGQRKWVKSGGKPVNATISGGGSVMSSVATTPATGSYGKPCSYYQSSPPSSCMNTKFSDIFACTGKTCSNNVAWTANKTFAESNCVFDKKIKNIFAGNTMESHWATAYCNSISDGAGYNFPYSPAQIKAFFSTDERVTSSAYKFFKDYMQTGSLA